MVVSALVLSVVAVILSAALPLLLRDGTLRSAFNALEDEFEQLRESNKADMGRISRLKRTLGEATQSTEPEEPTAPNGWSKTQSTVQAQIMRRRGVLK